MLRFKVTADQHASLSPEIQAEYKKDGDGYVLDTVGDHPSVTVAQNQMVALSSEKLKLEGQLAEANAKLATADTTAEAKYKKTVDDLTTERNALRDATIAQKQTAAVSAIAERFKSPELFAGVLRDRVRTEINDKGEVSTKYYDKDGAETTAEKLTEEYCKNPQYASYLKAATSTVTTPPTNLTAPTPQTMLHSSQPTNVPQPAVSTDAVTGLPVVNMATASPQQIRDAIAAHAAHNQQQQ